MSAGYREYKGPGDAYRNDVVALVLVPLTDADDDTIEREPGAVRSGVVRHLEGAPGEVRVELATFHIGGSWYGMHSSDIVESIDVQRITSLPGLPAHVRGCVMYEGDPIMVVDLRDYVMASVPVRRARSSSSAVPPTGQRPACWWMSWARFLKSRCP
jgi:hypothetical protein